LEGTTHKYGLLLAGHNTPHWAVLPEQRSAPELRVLHQGNSVREPERKGAPEMKWMQGNEVFDET